MKLILALMLVWLVALTASDCLVIKAEKEFLKFADFVIDDNLKNVVQSGGHTYYVVDMGKADIGRPEIGVTFWTPVYVEGSELEVITNFQRKRALMVKEFEELDITGKQIAAQAGRFVEGKLKNLQERKETK